MHVSHYMELSLFMSITDCSLRQPLLPIDEVEADEGRPLDSTGPYPSGRRWRWCLPAIIALLSLAVLAGAALLWAAAVLSSKPETTAWGLGRLASGWGSGRHHHQPFCRKSCSVAVLAGHSHSHRNGSEHQGHLQMVAWAGIGEWG